MQSATKPSSSSPEWSSVSSSILVGLILIAAVAACFYPLSESEFLLWDEETLLVQNQEYQSLSTDALSWMFRTFFYGHYQPLAWISFALDFLLWGPSAPGFRWTSIALHTLNALLVYGIALRLMKFATGEDRSRFLGASAAALFFAVHPLRAEPVAWLANRNGLLATLFVLLCLTLYLDLHRPGVVRRAPRYLLSLLFFALALLSKASVMTFPAVLVILDLYPLGRRAGIPVRPRLVGLLLEKLPYLAISLPFAMLAVLAKREEGGLGSLADHGWIERSAQAVYGLVFYLWKTIVPVALSPLYLFGEQIDPTRPRYLLSVLALVGVVTFLVLLRRRAPWLVTAWVCYAVLLLPVLGLTQAGAQLVADRYAYLSCVPWAVLFGAAVVRLSDRDRLGAKSAIGSYMLYSGLALVLTLLGGLCHRQVQFWRSSVELWSRVLAIEPESHFGYQNRGRAHQLRGDLEEAIADYDRALELQPLQLLTYRSRGIARRESGDFRGAIVDLEQAARLGPDSAQAWIDLGVTRRAAGEFDRALADLSQAIQLRPRSARAYQQRGVTFEKAGDPLRALADLDQSIRLNPAQYRAYHARGRVQEALGDLPGAAQDYSKTLALAPENWPPRDGLEQDLERLKAENRPGDP